MAQIILNRDEYLDKVLACWLGKNIGGTIGAPFEWKRQINDVSFYTQELGGEPMPNDDLDIQLLWLVALEQMGTRIDAHTLAEYWCMYVTPHWAEYGIGKVNMRSGIMPPLCGTVNNDEYKDSCGAFIRSEIWACIAPGLPRLAARFAYEDAILDHGNGEGTYAELFCAALESAAFVEKDIRKLFDIGLSYIPENCGVTRAIKSAIQAFDTGKSWLEARDLILEEYRGKLAGWAIVSDRDREKGFADGKIGYDVPSNIGMLVIGLLYGNGDFDKTICIAVNCGEDTDCTAATAGSIFGILYGTKGIPKKWIDPIGRSIKTISLNLGDLGHFGSLIPQTVDDLTCRTEKIAQQVLASLGRGTATIEDSKKTTIAINPSLLNAPNHGADYYRTISGTRFTFPFFTVFVDYNNDPIIRSGAERQLRIVIDSTYHISATLHLHWYLPEGFTVLPTGDRNVLLASWKSRVTVDFSFKADQIKAAMNRAVLEITIDSRPSTMLVPVMFMNS
jgi:ADP-ribosylglycohydrolase